MSAQFQMSQSPELGMLYESLASQFHRLFYFALRGQVLDRKSRQINC